ncbi:MAG: ACT domain-containing protein, partial [Pseudoxanthomonas sp.]
QEGLEQPADVGERVAEARESARVLMAVQGFDGITAERLFAAMPEEAFLRYRPEQIAWQASALVGVVAGETRVRVRRFADDADALEVFVHAPDRSGLFAAILATLDRMGLRIHTARVLDGPAGTIFDTFEVLPVDNQASFDPATIEATTHAALTGSLDAVRTSRRATPRLLKYFRFAPRLEFGRTSDGKRTRLSLVAPDRPGLLSDVAQVLRRQGLNVHDARIATFGERAEDLFQLTDSNGEPLSDAAEQALRDALHVSFEKTH